MNDGGVSTISRVVVVANQDGTQPPISLATEIAQALKAELHGLFIRDQRLRDLAASPFALTLGPVGGANRSITSEAMERAWSRDEARFRETVASRASSRRISFSLRSAEGAFGICLMDGIDRTDLIALSGEPPWTSIQTRVEIVLTAARRAHGVLIMGRRGDNMPRRAPILVLEPNDAGLRREVRDLAVRLSHKTGRRLVILATGDKRSQDTLRPHLHDTPQMSVHHIAGATADQICHAASRFSPAIVITDVPDGNFDMIQTSEGLLASLLSKVNAPLLLMRADQTETTVP